LEPTATVVRQLEATQEEGRVLVQELVEEIAPGPGDLTVACAPRLSATLDEVGVQNRGVRGATRYFRTRIGL
jgi:polyhydroxyalkanoate synthesis regulator phasin